MISPLPLRILFKVWEECVTFVKGRFHDTGDKNAIDETRVEALFVDFRAANEEDAGLRVFASRRVECFVE